MSIEELLKPRYKVIADYFFSPYKIGDIITLPENNRSVHLTTTQHTDEFGERVKQQEHYAPKTLEKYPHLFQPLPWYAERAIEEMPTYIKEVDSLYKIGEVIKVAEWELESEDQDMPCFRDEKDEHFTWVRGFEPATEADYNAFINQTQQP